ncbi:glutamate-1-semialdehyde 2,1-aminomutase [Amphibacillus sediminis]|uniref:glutamate-1-semialdehyde 2,1-aminomutase n=1 Tax=Amphibacillus sediminis TaxID=360185 RepID=UPI00082F6600|nr:glutamate-1-semialdehyde 2,1-aminomutase [Amphibacillus sediminis]
MKVFNESIQAYQTAKELLPGGVNSPARAFKAVGMNPIFMERGSGSRITDIDGQSYIDYVLSWGPLILGHAHPHVVEKLKMAVEGGTSFGTPTRLENELASLIIERVPSIEMVRMVNSGTEATMSALRLARGYTGRSKIIKFVGCYHGHGDSLLIKAGSGVATLGLPDSPGVPKSVAEQTITVPYNDLASVRYAFDQFNSDIAAVIVEPVAGNMGVVPPNPGFLEELRTLTRDAGSLLIFDEVMTGFRVGYHSAQGHYNVTPDLTCLGKVIGGGLPVGAYGGRRDIMEWVAPVGSVYQAGTLSGNPLAMTAGLATLSALDKQAYEILNQRLEQLVKGYQQAAKRHQISLQVNRAGSMVGFFFNEQPVTDYQIAQQSNHDYFKKYYQAMIEAGIFLPPSPYEGVFLSTAHTKEDIELTIVAADRAFAKIKAAL